MKTDVYVAIGVGCILASIFVVFLAIAQAMLNPVDPDCPCEMVKNHECQRPSCDDGFCPTRRP